MAGAIGITGCGILCAIGNDAAQVLDSLQRKESGIRPLKYLESRHTELPAGEVQMSSDRMKEALGITDPAPVSRTSLMGALAIRQALLQAGITDTEGRRVTLISGTTVGGMDITEKYFERMKTDDSLLGLPQSNECGKSTVEMAQICGLGDAQVCTISTACSSALNSIIVGAEMLRRGETDIVIAGGSEALSRFHFNGFNTLMILDKERCRPFDASRAGLNLGEGAAFVVLERDPARPLAYIAGYGNRCDAFHQTASSDDGQGAFLAMSDALRMAGLQPSDIQYVNAHGTGTPNNDLSESHALQRVFGQDMPQVSSTKAFTGHTTSASGSIETVICLLAMQHGFTPANLGWKTQIEGGIRPTEGCEGITLNNVVCNAFGFGGNDSSLILSRERPQDAAQGRLDSTQGTWQNGRNAAQPVQSGYGWKVAAEDTVSSVEELSALREFISPMESRRMGKLLKAAHLSSLRAMKKAGIQCPDAIIAATSRGMLEVSQQFLDDIEANGEELLKPTLFMQSTHNTIGSAIAIRTRCHGYNITYSQGDESMEWAMKDAVRLISTGKACTVLVGCYDESTPVIQSFCERSGIPAPDEIHAKTIILTRN